MRKTRSLKHTFISTMLVAVALIAGLSVLTIWGCGRLQKIIMPDANGAYLHVLTTDENGKEEKLKMRLEFGEEKEAPTLGEQIDGFLIQIGKEVTTYSIEKIESSYESLSPKRKIAYSGLSVCKVLLPALYSIIGTLLSAIWFYRKKLNPPISILTTATENIAAENLDFEVVYDSGDEMGRLCASFETMRKAMYENNQTLWHMLEERRMLQASLAHDLRNPIAIIEGYTEYLQEKVENHTLSDEKLQQTLAKLDSASKRLSRYTESIRDIQRLEDMEIEKRSCQLPDLLMDMAEDFVNMASQGNLSTEVEIAVENCFVMVDSQILYRILENIFTNAMRFAVEKISISAAFSDELLRLTVIDDGPGFSEEMLKVKNRYNLSITQEGPHMGMGLIISRILCEKHGGTLRISNDAEGGGRVDIEIFTKKNQ